MKPYERYKPSGIEWIGQIPAHWNCLRIKRLSNVKRGASPRPIDDPKYFDGDGEFAWVRIADVTRSERYLESTIQRLSELGSSLSVKRYPGDLFLSIAGTVGKPIITRIKCCIHDGFVWFPHLKTNPEYLYYIFSTGLPYRGLGKWGTQLNLNTDAVGEIFVPLPEKQEIENIIRYLDERTRQIDKLIATKKKLTDLLSEEMRAIINQVLTKGLKPNVPMKDSGIPWLGEIPGHWNIKPIKYLLKPGKDGIRIGPFGSSLKSEFLSLSGYKIYGQENIINNNFDLGWRYVNEAKFSELSEYEIIPGDVLVTMMGTTGKCKVVPRDIEKGIMDSHLIRMRIDNGQFQSQLFADSVNEANYVFNQIKMMSKGSIMEGLNTTIIKQIMLIVPARDEQTAIAQHIETENAKMDATISKIGKEIELLQEYRTTLISDAVTGKIDVRGVN